MLDPNVLLSALLSPAGAPARIVKRWLGGYFELIVSPALRAEARRALAYPRVQARVGAAEADALLQSIDRRGVRLDDPPDAPRVVSSDPGDDYLVALALASEAHVLVSGDRHLVELEAPPLPIVTPGHFLEGLGRL